MYAAALRVPLRQAIASQRRSFVSTVLLTKAWENETVAELRKEARNRGLSSKGNKATLITRLQQDEKNKAFAPEPTPAAPQVRRASTSTETPTEVPGIPSTAEPNYPKYNLDIKVPEAAVPEVEAPVPIPFVPDSWDSSKLRHELAPVQSSPSTEPKVVVIGGEETHPGGGPSHNLYSPSPSSSADAPRPPPKTAVGQLLADMADDIGVPTTFKLPGAADGQYDVAAKTETSGPQGKTYSRTLDQDEKKGLWVLFGVFAGSWIAASAFTPTSEWAHKVEEKVEEKAQDVQEKAAGKKH
ncbi:hypothetical protein L226DRAFT_530300 [Lentinus tigrinus ALCF2SS1-7]|uniref:SAP domain-containing protein n=1 Tax=Lentinus tigrinus ALCF2SS1-6 TaxID=1328759 RepID=A0A5C2SR82_9APHY|nr:hypothetical protein L227DRAFT_648949 [Lentinus tigrinus ALCF2SS1-6]RPD80110.1 hypothetical protein L226DRAFT_530300 [Lentinus tigrinus ALCF2SS1-7]